MWNLPPPPGFQGLRDDLPLKVYQQALPHWRQEGATYFVTYRLHDSLPQSKLAELRSFKRTWEQRHPPPQSRDLLDDLAREMMRRVETWLDQGMGSCCLRADAVRQPIIDGFHAVVRPLSASLERILQLWKGSSSRKINEQIGSVKTLWQPESFDRIVRDAEHLWRTIQYIGRNAAQAKLPIHEAVRWIRPEWAAIGWGFES